MTKVLIVDDNEQNLYLLEALLNGSNYKTTLATNGSEALKSARQNPPDLIISDILMPVMDGFTLCREWRLDDSLKNIPFVFYTATYTDPKDEKFALSIGADRFLVKPQEPDIFVEIIKDVLLQHEKKLLKHTAKPQKEDKVYLKKYNEALIRKLEKKTLDLEENQKILQDKIEQFSKAEIVLKKEKQRNEQILQTMLDGYILADQNGMLVDVNSTYCKMIGYTADELKKMDIRQLEVKIGEAEVQRRIDQLINIGHDHFETTHKHKDGHLVDLDVSISIMPEESGPLVAAFVRDITEQKKTQRAISQSEKQYRAIVEDTPVLICRFLADGEITFVNQAYSNYFELDREQLIGETFWSLIPAEDRKFVQENIASLTIQKPTQTHEHKVISPGKIIRWQRWTNRALFSDVGELEVYQSIGEDITDRKLAEVTLSESEYRYKNIFQSATVSLWEEDLSELKEAINELKKKGVSDFRKYLDDHPEFVEDGISKIKILDVNQATLKMYEAESKEELLGSLHNVFVPESFNVFKEEIITIAEGKESFEIEASNRTLKGNPLHILMHLSIPQKTSDFKNLIVSITDITERKKIEQNLVKSESYFRTLYEHSPMIIWEEDFSEVKEFIDRLKNEGVNDFRSYFDNNPKALEKIAGQIKVINVNEYSLEFYRADSKESLLTDLPSYFVEESWPVLKEEILVLAEGKSEFKSEIPIRTSWGELKSLIFTVSIPLEYRENWQRVLVSFVDITDRKEADRLLRESEERFRLLATNASDMLYRMSLPDGKYEYVSPASKKIFGYSPQEFYQSAALIGNIIHPDWHSYFEKEWAKLIIGEMSPTYEYQVIHKSGKVCWIHQRNSLIKNEKGQPTAIAGVVSDITERKKIEKTLATLMSNLPGMAYSCLNNEDWEMLFVSEGCFELTGYRKHELVGNTKYSYGKIIHPDHREKVWDIVQNSIENHFELEYRIITKKGEEKWVWEKGLMLKEKINGCNIIEGFINDITLRKQAEQKLHDSEKRYRSLVETSPDGIAVTDLDGNFTIINKKAVELHGFDSADELIGISSVDFVSPVNREELHRNAVEALKNGIAYSFEYTLFRKDGSSFPAEANATTIFDSVGNPQAFLTIFRDISERKKAEEEVHNSREQLRALSAHLQAAREEERSSIARDLHDEFGQILTVLKMDVSLIEQEIAKKDNELNIDFVNKEISSIYGLLDKTALKVSDMVTHLRPGILDNLGFMAALEWHLDEFQKKTKIRTKLITKIKILDLSIDQNTSLFRIVQEAFTNVSKHAKASEVEVSIRKTKKNLIVSIKDNGIGIKDEKLVKKGHFGLLGIRERAVILGGELKIKSGDKIGTTLKIDIPFS
ncbi:MAG: PAS domain S-box protein [Calditrichaeota bacterium]|nr:MAG: PAS domain S-box protein [Calditrichota bacterium]MBL1205645.1 PAS domain S-box protein [Calditrichota bacterium]NOG45473.1 PAS domain S-box protein [Calditrichota bacterium]